jgi:hypothetical protein
MLRHQTWAASGEGVVRSPRNSCSPRASCLVCSSKVNYLKFNRCSFVQWYEYELISSSYSVSPRGCGRDVKSVFWIPSNCGVSFLSHVGLVESADQPL